MITQIKSKKPLPENTITLEVHPEVRMKLKINRIIRRKIQIDDHSQEKKGQNTDSPKNKLTFLQATTVDNNQYFHPSPKKVSRPQRLSSYQLYKSEQKWSLSKNGRPNQPITSRSNRSRELSQNKSNLFSKAKSFCEVYTHQRKREYPSRLIQTINFEHIKLQNRDHYSEAKPRSLYIKTSEGRSKVIGNHFHQQENRTQRQFKSFQTLFEPLKNNVLRFSPTNLQEEGKIKKKLFYKPAKSSRNTKSPLKFQFEGDCRPWSGYKNQLYLVNQPSTFLA